MRLQRHQVPVFTNEKGRALKKYSHGGKVLDRLSSRTDHFVLNNDKLLQCSVPVLPLPVELVSFKANKNTYTFF